MSLHDWLLFLHVLAAFAVVAGVVLLAIAVAVAALAVDPNHAATALSLTGPGGRLFDSGGLGTLVFGVWLAFEADGYAIWDGWIVAALVLWIVAAASGGVAETAYRRTRDRAEELAAGGVRSDELRRAVLAPRALGAQSVAAAAILAILVLMIFKPGAG